MLNLALITVIINKISEKYDKYRVKKVFLCGNGQSQQILYKKNVKKILLQKNLIKMKDLALKLQFYHVH